MAAEPVSVCAVQEGAEVARGHVPSQGVSPGVCEAERRSDCGEHGGLCAYRGDEPERCRWCHSTWAAIAALFRQGWVDGKGKWHPYLWSEVHSCEQASVWRGKPRPVRRHRVREAARMRARGILTASAVQEGTCSASVGKPTAEGSPGVCEAERRVNAGTRGIVYVECAACCRRYGVMVETVDIAKCSHCCGPVTVVGAPDDHGRPSNDELGLKTVRAVTRTAS